MIKRVLVPQRGRKIEISAWRNHCLNEFDDCMTAFKWQGFIAKVFSFVGFMYLITHR